MNDPQSDLIERIRAENLNVYRASPARLREDVGSEAEIAHDYQGRLIFELLQNADDAMAEGSGGIRDRIRFRLTDNELLVMNSGRALTEADVRGLTATGASSKTGSSGLRRASIGHKGMGFKSILEITDRPQVFSKSFAFVLDAAPAHAAVSEVLAEFGQEPPQRVPIMRFPWNLESPQDDWTAAQTDGFNVLFRFPFKSGIDRDKVSNLAEALLTLPATTILFLKHLEIVEIEIETSNRAERISWTLRREQADDQGGWEPTAGLAKSGVYQVWIESNGADDIWCFLLGHEADLAIGPHRGGLNAYAWEGVELTEVTVAALATGGDNDELPAAWRRFHVFLPTAETSPYPLLVNGAFATDLSRQEIRVAAEAEDYNHFLIESAARVLRDRLLPAIQSHGGGITAALRLLERDAQQPALLNAQSPAQEFHRAVIAALGQVALVPIGGGRLASVGNLAVPETFGHPSVGSELRGLLNDDAKADGRPIPVAKLCSAPFAGILADHGAHLLSPAQTADLLGHADPARTRLTGHVSTKLSIDPVLEILQTMWQSADKASRDELERAVRGSPLFPVAKRPDGTIERIAVGDTETFFPPRALHGSIPLQGLRFMLQDLCWGTLTPRERTEILRAQMPAWIALFQIREFKFPDVMRVSVLPSLALEAAPHRRDDLANWETLAAVCQLAGPTPNPDMPLPYGRLGSQRALTPLCRIPVPCTVNGEEQWVPAYRAYFGETWVANASVEPLIEAAGRADPALNLDLPVIVGPDRFVAHLDRLRGLEAAVQDGEGNSLDDKADDEVDLDEDEEQATELDAKERWLAFLTWLGVNHVLRPVHFHDAEDRAKGWISTRGLDRPSGWAFRSLGSIWDDYSNQLRDRLLANSDAADGDRYFYRLHDLEHLGRLAALAASDTTGCVASTLFSHLAKNWNRLERFSEVELAVLARGTQPGRRVDPPRADAKELKRFGPDLWLFRLQRASFCPTGHGPRRPELTWWRSSEVERRFNRRGSSADMFLPVLDEAASIPANEAKRFAQAVGVRVELTPAVFTIRDAIAFVQRIEHLFGEHVAALTPEQLRNQIHPAYQNLFELLSGSATTGVAPNDLAALEQAPLLVHDGHGQHHFAIAATVLYATRSGLREILGIEGELWTFVLEGRPAIRAPLQRLFGARNLDEVLNWQPQTDEPSLHGPELELFRKGLLEVAPFLLARLRAERAEEEQATRDAGLIREFIEKVQPVRHLTASCTFDGLQLVAGGDRQAFVKRTSDGVVAFVRWGENPWPPDPSEAEALATGITDLLGVGYLEPLLALLTAEPSGRARLLHLAGASGNLNPARVAISDSEPPGVAQPKGPVLPPPTQGETVDDGDGTTDDPGAPGPSARVRLVELAALSFDGEWIIETGEPPGVQRPERGNGTGSHGGSQRASAYGGGTDLNELDRVGMHVATVFEKRRLARDGLSATIFDIGAKEPQPTDAIYDVSTASAIARAAELSGRFKQALATLARRGITADVPGFDILTLDERDDDDIGRLIELKSSGVSARTQTMTWNEWKTAGHADLRARFFLYLVGNLRADIDTAPFIRTIRDPFGELLATEQTNRTLRRSVQLDVTAFRQAEFQELTVRAADSSE